MQQPLVSPYWQLASTVALGCLSWLREIKNPADGLLFFLNKKNIILKVVDSSPELSICNRRRHLVAISKKYKVITLVRDGRPLATTIRDTYNF